MTSRTIITTGSESIVYRISHVEGDVIVKERRPKGHQQYPFEAYAYQALEKQGAKVPHVISVSDNGLTMTALRGHELDDHPEHFANKELFTEAATDLARAHCIALSGFGHACKDGRGHYHGEYASWRAHLDRLTPLLFALRPGEGLTPSELDALRSHWTATLPHIHLAQGVLVHGDFAMTAIFAQGGTYTGLIDFGDAFVGDPLVDLAYFRFKEVTKPYGQATFDLLKQGYVQASARPWSPSDDGLVVFYMIYWAMRRLEFCVSEQIRDRFLEKLRATSLLC